MMRGECCECCRARTDEVCADLRQFREITEVFRDASRREFAARCDENGVVACDGAEDGVILFVGNSVEDKDTRVEGTWMEGVKLPDPPRGWGGDRMEMRDFRFELKVLDHQSVGVYFTSTFEPKVALPKSE